MENTLKQQGFIIVLGKLLKYKGTEVDLTIPDCVKSISDFAIPAHVRTVRFGANVTKIEAEAFGALDEESDLETIYYDGTVEDWLKIGFGGYAEGPDGCGPVSGNPMLRAQNVYFQGELLTDIVIPPTVDKIGAGQFQGLKQAHTIRFGASVKTIEIAAMLWSGISTIYFDGTEDEWDEIYFDDCSLPEKYSLYIQGKLVKAN